MAEETGPGVEVWRRAFQELIQQVRPWHAWTLTLDKSLLPSVLKPGWMEYQLCTFARFSCSSCSRSWASGHVQVLFHMHWSEEKGRGQVKMRVFAQKCKKCSQSRFEAPEISQENISRVLNNLVLQILKKCYRERFKMMEEIPAIKNVSLQGPHDSQNCEACGQGVCARSRPGQAKQPPESSPCKDTGESRLTATSSNLPCSQPASKAGKLLIATVSCKVPNPPKAPCKVSHTSEPPNAPRFLTQQVSPRSSLAPGLATQMLSPPRSSTAAGGAARVTRAMAEEKLSSSSFLARPTRPQHLPTSWRPATKSVRQVERRIQIHHENEHSHSYPSPNRTQMCICCCCVILIVLVVVIVIVTKRII